MLVRFYTPAGVMNTPSNMGYIHVGMCSPKEYGLCTSYLSVELGASLWGEGGRANYPFPYGALFHSLKVSENA